MRNDLVVIALVTLASGAGVVVLREAANVTFDGIGRMPCNR